MKLFFEIGRRIAQPALAAHRVYEPQATHETALRRIPPSRMVWLRSRLRVATVLGDTENDEKRRRYFLGEVRAGEQQHICSGNHTDRKPGLSRHKPNHHNAGFY